VRVTSELHESLALQCEKIGFADDIDQILLAARQHIGERTRDHPVIGRSETAGLEAFDGEFERPAAGAGQTKFRRSGRRISLDQCQSLQLRIAEDDRGSS
jgi:hypothetical protein